MEKITFTIDQKQVDSKTRKTWGVCKPVTKKHTNKKKEQNRNACRGKNHD